MTGLPNCAVYDNQGVTLDWAPRADVLLWGLCGGLGGPRSSGEIQLHVPDRSDDHLQLAQACQADLPTFGHLYGDDWATPHSSFGMGNDGAGRSSARVSSGDPLCRMCA